MQCKQQIVVKKKQLQIKLYNSFQWLFKAKILQQQTTGARGQAGLLICNLNFTKATAIKYTHIKTTSRSLCGSVLLWFWESSFAPLRKNSNNERGDKSAFLNRRSWCQPGEVPAFIPWSFTLTLVSVVPCTASQIGSGVRFTPISSLLLALCNIKHFWLGLTLSLPFKHLHLSAHK